MKPTHDEEPLWSARLARFLRDSEPSTAVEWEEAETELQLATVGRVDEQALRRDLARALKADVSGSVNPLDHPSLQIHRESNRTRIEKAHGCGEVTQFWTWRKIPWPSAAEVAGVEDHGEEEEDWRFLAGMAVLCGLFGTLGFIAQVFFPGPDWLPVTLYLIAMIFGGWDAAKDAGPSLLRGKVDIHFLMLAVAVGASIIGAYGEGALLLFLFSFAGALEHFALHRTRREIDALFKLAPKTAMRRDPATGEEVSVPVEVVRPGDVLVVRPGDTFAVDGKVVEGSSAADESSLTGEAHPVEKMEGAVVRSGTHNLWGSLEVRCLRPASESSLQKVIRLIENARGLRAPSQRFVDRFGPGYTRWVLAVTLAMFLVWWGVFDLPPFVNQVVDGEVIRSALYRAMTLLVVASPCALVLSIPSAILAAIAWGARHGILFRGGAAIEGMARIGAVALDKTGTLTNGQLSVESVESFPKGRDAEVLELAAALESRASHPIARAIVAKAKSEGVEIPSIEAFVSLTGLGVKGTSRKKTIYLGSRAIFEYSGLSSWAEELPESPVGLTEIWLVADGLMGRILLRDTVRPESREVIEGLGRLGIRTIMLTGDRKGAADFVGEALQLDEIQSGLRPEDKVAALQSLRERGFRVAMVGDGINDAPALAAADIAVAMGGRGSDAAIEQSDLVLMNDRVENLLAAFQLSRRARRIIVQNLVVALGTMGVMVGAAVLGAIPITIGVIAHEGSTLLVCLNSMRLLGGRAETKSSPK